MSLKNNLCVKSNVNVKASLFAAEKFMKLPIPGLSFTERESEDLSQTEVLIQGLLSLDKKANHTIIVNQDHVVFT